MSENGTSSLDVLRIRITEKTTNRYLTFQLAISGFISGSCSVA